MDFILKKYGKYNFVNVKKKVLDAKTISTICGFIKKSKIAIDCKNIERFENSITVSLLYSLDIALINADPYIIAQAGLLGGKNFPKIYLNKDDYIKNKRQLVRRRFKLV